MFGGLSLLEWQELYYDLMKRLRSPFPHGTVKGKGDKANIPVQAYRMKLETEAGPYYKLADKSTTFLEGSIIHVVTLTILGVERDGTGVAKIQSYNDSGKSFDIKSVVSTAKSNAIKDACDQFQMGWVDLAPHREWAKEPGVGLINTTSNHENSTNRFCVKCKAMNIEKELSVEDISELESYNIKMDYCIEHIPSHMIRNYLESNERKKKYNASQK